MPSLGSSSGRRRSSRPSRSQPQAVRFESGSTAYSCRSSGSTAASVNQSSRGPSRSGSSSTSGRARGTASPRRRRSPRPPSAAGLARLSPDVRPPRRVADPSPVSVSVDRLPRTAGTSTPPATASQDRMPSRGRADLDRARRRAPTRPPPTATGRPRDGHPDLGAGDGDPRRTLRAQPDATEQDLEPCRVRPVADQPVGERERLGVQGTGRGTPRWLDPARPRSCTSRNGPGSSTSKVIGSGTSSNRTRSPGWSSAGSSRSTSNITSSVLPISCHPPGMATG